MLLLLLLQDGMWKYVYMAMNGTEQLFHLEEDPNEMVRSLCCTPTLLYCDITNIFPKRLTLCLLLASVQSCWASKVLANARVVATETRGLARSAWHRLGKGRQACAATSGTLCRVSVLSTMSVLLTQDTHNRACSTHPTGPAIPLPLLWLRLREHCAIAPRSSLFVVVLSRKN